VQDGRLYYSSVEGPQIWSVGLNADGSFADDARLEIDVTGTPNGNVITDIAFDGAGVLYLAQRGEIVGSYDYSVFAKQDASSVLRYVWNETERRWSAEAEEYAIGLKPPHRSTQGGHRPQLRLRSRRQHRLQPVPGDAVDHRRAFARGRGDRPRLSRRRPHHPRPARQR
jgi:hypothetical protein